MSGCADPAADDLCHPTTENCPCSAAGTCIEGLTCVDNLCLEPDEWTVFLSSTEARSCDLLLDADEGTRVSGVAYGTGVRGHFEQRGRLTGVAMISTTSAAMPKEPLRVQGFGEPPRIREARCAGGRGQPLADATLSIP